MMRLLILFLCIFQINLVKAESFELGAIFGSPTGISAKYNLNSNRSVDFALAYSIRDYYGLHLHMDYLIENAYQLSLGSGHSAALYYGIGGRLAELRASKNKDDLTFGPRAPIGLEYVFSNPKIKMFLEAAIILEVIPETDSDVEAGIGLRYTF